MGTGLRDPTENSFRKEPISFIHNKIDKGVIVMFSKRWTLLIALFLVGLLLLPLVVVTRAEPKAPAATIIVVDSSADPDDSLGKTCISEPTCTLRRAIVQAVDDETERPVLIKFDIPKTDQGYNSTLGVWELEIYKTTRTEVYRRLKYGQITIDGTTQPGGRSGGPKIILIGPGTGNKTGLIVGNSATGADDENVIRGLGFQNLKTHMYVNSNDNLIEDNWFGLTSNGKGVYLRDDEPEDGSGNAGVALSAGVQDNMISDNVFLGFDGVAAAFRGERNEFSSNYVGTDAAGKVPGKQTDPDLICTPVDWLGGGGLSMEGDQHQIKDNIFAGLRQEIFHGSTQPDAISATGEDHQISENQIGKAKDGLNVGVCGRGVYLHGSPEGVLVNHNIIINPGYSGISLNGVLADANTFRSNVIKNRFQWTEDDFNPAPEDAIQLGPSIPFRDFNPARVTKIDGKTVKGTNGYNSPCPKCVVELFLDDNNGIKEALQSLAVVTADDNGNWTAQIPSELTTDQRIRTTSTTAKYNTIPNTSAGTTTALSGLYQQQKPCQGGSSLGFGVCLPAVLGK